MNTKKFLDEISKILIDVGNYIEEEKQDWIYFASLKEYLEKIIEKIKNEFNNE